MKKFCSIVLSIVVLALLLTGCGPSVADEKKLQEDLSSYAVMSGLLNEGEEIKALEIEKRQTEKERRLDVVWCNVTTEDTECRYEKTAVLTYTLYDEGGWILENATVNDSAEWRISPLVGVTEDIIKSSVYETGVSIDSENWYASESSMKGFSITAHETDLEKRIDTVTVKFAIEDLVKQAAGEMTLNYTFDQEWKLESVTGNDGFTVSDIAGKELKVTDEDLVDVLLGLEYQYGETPEAIFFSNSTQNITVDKSELSDFGIDSQENTEKGALQTITCHTTLTKPFAVFTLMATIPYRYTDEEGWKIQTVETALECISVDILGEWTGKYEGGGIATLNITKCDEKGTIEGVYGFTPATIGFTRQEGSYQVSGQLDFTTLEMNLVAGDWVKEAVYTGYAVNEKRGIKAILNINDSSIEGSGHRGLKFKVSK